MTQNNCWLRGRADKVEEKSKQMKHYGNFQQKFHICFPIVLKSKIISYITLPQSFFVIVAPPRFVKVSYCHGDQEFSVF